MLPAMLVLLDSRETLVTLLVVVLRGRALAFGRDGTRGCLATAVTRGSEPAQRASSSLKKASSNGFQARTRQRTCLAPFMTWQGISDKSRQEGAEVHPQELPALLVVLGRPAGADRQQQGAPGLYAPSEGGHGHVGPVGDQSVDWGVQGAHLTFQLGDQVLLVAAPSGLADHLVVGHRPVVGDGEVGRWRGA